MRALIRHGPLAAALLAALASPAPAAAPEVTARPERVLLGTVSEVTVEVHASSAHLLRAYASTGTLSRPQVVGASTARYTWTPPAVRSPHTALLLFWTERGADPPELAVLRLPLVGRTDLEVNTEPRADVRVEVGERTFGPRRADGRGHAIIPVEVPPGADHAKVLSEVGGVSKAVQVPLALPPINHLAAVGGPDPLPRSGGWAWLVAVDKLELQDLRMEASGGAVALSSSAAALPDRALLAVRPSADAQAVSLTFRTGDPNDVATVNLDVEEPSIARPRAISSVLLQPGMLLGATYGGGGNLSVLGSVDLSASFPRFGTAFAAGLSLEGNSMGLSSQVAGLGRLDSWILSLSPLVTARYQLLELGAVALHVRAGAGPVFFAHQVRSDFEPAWNERGVTAQAFAGVEISYRVGPLDMVLEARAAAGQVQTGQVNANIGGMVFGLGARVIR